MQSTLWTMGSGWQVKFFQTLLCACSVSVSFHLSVKRESWRKRVHQRAENPIEHMDQNPAAQAPPEKDPMFEWNSQLVQSRRDFTAKAPLREKPLVEKTPKMPETLQMGDPIVRREGVQVPQRPLMMDLPKDGSRNQPGRSSQNPRRSTTTATQRPLSYEVNASQRQLNDRLVQIPVKQELQRPLMMNLPKDVMFAGSRNQPGQSYEGPQHSQKPQPSETSASRKHSSQTWQPSPAQSSQRPQLTAVETLPKDQKTELRQPETPQSVTAVCGEELLQLTVKMDFLGTGHLINPADITLGGCAPTRLDESQQELLFETALHECGGTAQVPAGVCPLVCSCIS